VSPEQLLGQLAADRRVVVADLEAGLGTLTRLPEAALDAALLVVEPSPQSIEVARRARELIRERNIGPTLIIANRVRAEADVERIREALDAAKVVVVPEDPAVLEADRRGVAPYDDAPHSAAVQAITALAVQIQVGAAQP
jgi:CO dehydrogenase maturation factor